MEGMDHDHGGMGHDHGGMGGKGTAPTAHGHGGLMMHMSFYWGHEAIVLFTGWPGRSKAMYALCLIFTFFLALVAELLTHSRLIRAGPVSFCAGLAQTLVHAIKVGLCYMVMLAVMSFNVGVLLAAVAGHALGFMLFGSRAFKRMDNKGSVVVQSHC